MTNIIYIGSDHAGFRLKERIKKFLTTGGRRFEDMGACTYDKHDDYPDYAVKVCEKVKKTGGKGILICGSGQGVSIAANKIPGIRAAVCWNEYSAKMAKEHLNANVLCLSGRALKPGPAKKMVNIWLKTMFRHEKRHVRRINKIKAIERKY